MPPAAPPVETKPPDTKPAELEPEPVAKSSPSALRRSRAMPQPVLIISSPGGAMATMDGKSETACTTPCSIDATPGRHSLAITMPGYQLEHRDVDVGSSPQELPAVVLQPFGGTVWLSSVPSGAAVLVNGKRLPQITPAQIQLAPGTYKITVEKDGKQASRTVDVHSGISYLKLLFEP
jgi:hypothetical protein